MNAAAVLFVIVALAVGAVIGWLLGSREGAVAKHTVDALRLQLDEVVAAARDFSDQVAERMRAIYVAPDGRATTVAKQSSLAEFPTDEVDTAEVVDLMAAALHGVARTARRIHDDVDAEDPTTADLLHVIIERTEQLAWMVEAENRVAGSNSPRVISE